MRPESISTEMDDSKYRCERTQDASRRDHSDNTQVFQVLPEDVSSAGGPSVWCDHIL